MLNNDFYKWEETPEPDTVKLARLRKQYNDSGIYLVESFEDYVNDVENGEA